MGDEVAFLLADKHKRFLRVDSITLDVQSQVTRHAQITQNNKFTISLQCLTKEVGEEVDFLHAEEDEGFLQMNTKVLMVGMIKHS